MALMGHGQKPPAPMMIPLVLGAIVWANWYFGGPPPLTYFLGGLAIILAICDVTIFIGTGGQGQ